MIEGVAIIEDGGGGGEMGPAGEVVVRSVREDQGEHSGEAYSIGCPSKIGEKSISI